MRQPARTETQGKTQASHISSGAQKGRTTAAMTPDEKRAVIDQVLEMVRHLPNEDGVSAARSQDFLYGDDGLPE